MPETPTIPALFQATVARVAEQPAVGIICDGKLSWKTWSEVAADVSRVQAGLQAAGVKPGDRVVQFSPNSYEWILTDLAILSLCAVHVPLHASLPAAQAAEQLQLADAALLVVTNQPQSFLNSENIKSVTHSELIGNSSNSQSPVPSPQSSYLATILFTSGTTGHPRGVMLSHGNLATNAIATTKAVGSPHEETRLCFLPLSHIYARTCDLYTWLARGTRIVLAENRDTILRDCQLVRPTVLNGVPYFYQKVAQSLHAAGKSKQPGALLELLGGKVRLCFCGGAAVAPEVEKLFAEQGLPLLSGYGLTEAAPVITATRKENYCPGSVGRPLADVEVRLATDGEILARGPNVMLGYWRDEIATQAAIVDGWLHTGDLGEFDADGNLRIVGRRKEIFVLSTGKKVCPASVEQRLAGSPFVEAVCIVGDGRSHLGALIVPNPQALKKFIRENRLWVWSKHRAVTHPQVRKLFRAEIDRVLADAAREEHVGPFLILPRNFSLETGEVTAKFSLRREVIAKNFAGEIEAMFGG
ncbi:MAG: AMP-dependent synthetase/ligase [Bythopirellula sp.]|nr:AMP-dependent synthetase/ligase [Bythopirellula sp.]